MNTRPRFFGLVAAGLLAATALTATLPVAPPAIAAQAIVDPSLGFAELVDKVMPAVVSVEVKFKNVANLTDDDRLPGLGDMPESFRDFFNQLPPFREGEPRLRQPAQAQGSGFIISADGYAVTNNHVVQNAEEVTVTLKGGEELKAEVIGTDPKTDLALIKIKAEGRAFPIVQFAQDEPRVGDWVVAVGNPFGLGGTVTTGIVSALGRDIGSGPYDDFLQIDASINHGNSGGPTFNLAGEVVGVNTAIFSPSGGSVGIGFAIPASTAETIVDSLRNDGAVTRGWLGVQIQPVTDDIAESLGLEDDTGTIVSGVSEDSPAAAAGLKTGDTILKLDGKEVADARDLARKVAKVAPGASITLTIVRDGKTMDVSVKIGLMPDGDRQLGKKGESQEQTGLASLGLKLAPAPDGAGVKIVGVEPDSAAAERGLKEGDIILEVAGREVNGPEDVKEAMREAGKSRVLMLVRSGDAQRFVVLRKERG